MYKGQCYTSYIHEELGISDDQGQKLISPTKLGNNIKRKLYDLVEPNFEPNGKEKLRKFCEGCINSVTCNDEESVFVHDTSTADTVIDKVVQTPNNASHDHNRCDKTTSTTNCIIDVDDLDLTLLSINQKAKLAYHLALSESSNIYEDTLTLSNQRSLKELLEMNKDEYLANCNKVLVGFLCGISCRPWSPDVKSVATAPKCKIESPSDIYRLIKSTESCMALTKPISILPYHFREIILTYNMTRSRKTVDLFGSSTPSGSYPSLKLFLSSLPNTKLDFSSDADLLSVFDNNQILQRRWNITLDNTAQCHVITMVIFMEIENANQPIQCKEEYKPAQWKFKLTDGIVWHVTNNEISTKAKEMQYKQHIHPFITDAIKEVVSEQKHLSGTYEDEIDELVRVKAHQKNFKTCQLCKFSDVPRKARICPKCKERCSLTYLRSLGLDKEGDSVQEELTVKEKKPREMRAHVSKSGSDYSITYEEQELQHDHEYTYLGDKHCSDPPKLLVSEPLFLNPCSLEAVASVLRQIGHKAKLKQYDPDGDREWLSVAFDGLPFTLGIKVIENFRLCPECGVDTSLRNHDEATKHAIVVHEGRDVVFSREFGWVLLLPGPGHLEMNMVRSFVKTNWNVFWEDMVEIFNFKSPNAKGAAFKVNDHHKGWILCRIAKELLVPYVRDTLTEDPNSILSCSGFYKYCMTYVKDPNYSYMCDMILEMMDAIFLFRAGTRTGDTELMNAGSTIYSKMWAARNHVMYRELEAYDSFMNACMPAEVQEFKRKTMSINLSGVPYSGEGPDFKLESINKNVQRLIPAIAAQRDWQIACTNYNDLLELKKSTYQDMGSSEVQGAGRIPANIDKQVQAFRALLREKNYLSTPCEERDHVSLSGKPLDSQAIHFCRLAAENRARYIRSFNDHYSNQNRCGAVPFKERIVCITKDERDMVDDINKKTIAEITQLIELKLSLLDNDLVSDMSDEFNNNVRKKKALKEDYIAFHTFLEEVLEWQLAAEDTAEDTLPVDILQTEDS